MNALSRTLHAASIGSVLTAGTVEAALSSLFGDDIVLMQRVDKRQDADVFVLRGPDGLYAVAWELGLNREGSWLDPADRPGMLIRLFNQPLAGPCNDLPRLCLTLADTASTFDDTYSPAWTPGVVLRLLLDAMPAHERSTVETLLALGNPAAVALMRRQRNREINLADPQSWDKAMRQIGQAIRERGLGAGFSDQVIDQVGFDLFDENDIHEADPDTWGALLNTTSDQAIASALLVQASKRPRRTALRALSA